MIFNYKNKKKLAYVRGVDAMFTKTIALDSAIYNGDWFSPHAEEAVIGSSIANALGIGISDYRAFLEIYMPKAGKGQISNPTQAFRKVTTSPVGFFNINPEIDSKYVFVPLHVVQRLMNYKNK